MKRAALILALAAILTAAAAPVRTATENFVTNKIAEAVAAIPAPDYSTSNAALVATIQAKAPAPDLSPFLRKDLGQSGFQEFGGVLFGRYWADSWSDYTAHNGRTVMQTLPAYIQSNPWGFLKQGEAIPTTGGVYTAMVNLHFNRLSVGVWPSGYRPIDITGGSGAAFTFGDGVQAKRSNTMALGTAALNTNEWSFIWNGDANRYYIPSYPSMSNPYATRYNGGFHVNPSVRSGMVNPLQNFWIGDTNLNDWIVTLSPPATWATLSGKPTNVSAFENDAGYLTSYTESDPTVPQWAKAQTKPTYTASEVGALSSAGGTLFGNLTVESTGEKSEIRAEHGNEYIALQVKDNKATIETSDYSYTMPNSDGTVALTKNIPNVPAWALAAQKPTYTASEVGATSPTAVSNIVTTALVRERLGVYLYVGADGGIYVHTNED